MGIHFVYIKAHINHWSICVDPVYDSSLMR